MDTATVVFLVLGGLGVLLLALGLLGLDFLDLDGPFSLELVAAMLGAFGFTAAIANTALQSRTPAPLLLAGVTGAVVALPAGLLATRLVRAAQRMRTDATPVRDDLIGLIGTVVTAIPTSGFGEVRVTLGGQPVKLNARADQPVPAGTDVFVITTTSDTSVVVEQLSETP